MKTTLEGRIIDIFPMEVFGRLEKRVFWMEQTGATYNQTWSVEMQGNDCPTLDNFVPGDAVIAKCDIRGRAWEKNGKKGVINSLKCWSLERVGPAKPTASTRQQTGAIPPIKKADPIGEEIEDLPF